ncbi:hypothetical protein LBMAG42_44160 [Deltaproteobacteria bacterium]|nr:hypothetical protein LBMAG42_44160 [Deltaproteobacteria bacterium]
MAGYSGTPLPKKLGIKTGSRVRLLGAPGAFHGILVAELPEGAVFTDGVADVAIVFAEWERDLLERVAAVRPTLPDAASLWVAWPKRASKRPTDITEDRLRALFLPTGLVDNKVCAIDEVWSGLRFVLRVELRGR